MIKIEGIDYEYELDLNKSFETDYYLTIDSRNDKGKVIPWSIVSFSNPSIVYKSEGINKLHLIFNLEAIKRGEYIIIENYNKEKARIKIKPNLKESAKKVYTFLINGYDITDKDSIVFKIKSECNGEYADWKCTYNGKPYEYTINKTKNSIKITLKSIPLSDIIGFIQLTQVKSKKKKDIQLIHHLKEKMGIYKIG